MPRVLRWRVLIRAMRAALLAVVAFSAATATARLLCWCEPMGEARPTCCCHASDDPEGDPDVVRAPCCEREHTLAQASAEANETQPRIGSAVLSAPSAQPELAPATRRLVGGLARDYARAGPSGERLHAKNAVFLL